MSRPTRSLPPRRRGPLRQRWRVFRSRRVSVFALWLIALGLLAGEGAEFFPEAMKLNADLDEDGLSLLLRTLWGARLTLALGGAATLLATALGVGIGSALSGAFRVRVPFAGALDSLSALPTFLLVMLAMALLPDGTTSPGERLIWVTVTLGVTQSLVIAHVVQQRIRVVLRAPFVQAARLSGVSTWSLFWRTLLPHTTAPLAIATTMTWAECIGYETLLSFLRVGVSPPYRSLGTVLVEAYPTFFAAPGGFLLPALILALLVVGVQLIGDALFDAAVDRVRAE